MGKLLKYGIGTLLCSVALGIINSIVGSALLNGIVVISFFAGIMLLMVHYEEEREAEEDD